MDEYLDAEELVAASRHLWQNYFAKEPKSDRASVLVRGDGIDGEAAYDEFGDSVDLSADGTTVTIGAPNNDGTADNAGHVRVYALDIDIGQIFSDGFESGDTSAWM